MNNKYSPSNTFFYICLILLSFITFSSAQSVSDYADAAEIDELWITGDKNNRINFALANAGHFNKKQYESRSDLKRDVENILRRFDPNSPDRKNGFSHYRNFFNVYSVWFDDPPVFDGSPEWYQTSKGIIEKLWLPWTTTNYGWISMIYTLEGGGGGGVGRNPNKRLGDGFIWGLKWATVLHEFNHTMPGVRDEYTASGIWANFECPQKPNTTPGLIKDDIPWRKWIKDDTPIPTPYEEEYFNEIGAFQGTISGYFGCHRPTARSCYMGAGGFGEGFGQDMCAICLQRFICQTYKYVDAIEDKVPANNDLKVDNGETIKFSVNPIKPIPNTQKYEWFLNDKKIAEGVTNIEITFNQCASNEVRFVLTDETEFVRYDEKYKEIYEEPKQSHSWFINNDGGNDDSFDVVISTKNSDCTGGESGSIDITTNGGKAPFTYILNGKEYDRDIENVAAGTYTLSIVDANGCLIRKEVEVNADEILDFEIVSEFNQGTWTLKPVFKSGQDIQDMDYRWSNGSNQKQIVTTDTRRQRLEISTSSGCTIEKEIDISSSPISSLDVEHDIAHPTTDSGGSIHLDINYGTPPYLVKWYKRGLINKVNVDDESASFASGDENDGALIRSAVKYLFDGKINNDIKFWAERFIGNNYAAYDFGTKTKIDCYSITSNLDTKGRDAKAWKIQGSNNKSSWTTIDDRSNIDFESRLLRKTFLINSSSEYRYYRILVTENNDDLWLAIQELELGVKGTGDEIISLRDKETISDLSEGNYTYEVFDANNEYKIHDITLRALDNSFSDPVKIVQSSYDKVKVDNPKSTNDYYWYKDKEGTELLHIGIDFAPPHEGNYYVRPMRRNVKSFADENIGFAVTMQQAPEVFISGNKIKVDRPDSRADYFWYDSAHGGEILHEGTSYTPTKPGDYYVSARYDLDSKESINPNEISGISIWGDASDLEGAYKTDRSIESSAAYQWVFKKNGRWDKNGHFIYRANYANGLGIIDFATIWFQYARVENFDMRTLTVVYEENDYSTDGSAPFYGFKPYMGKDGSARELFTREVSNTMSNGKVYLNGDEINPRSEKNKVGELKILTLVLPNTVETHLVACDEYWEGKLAEFIVWDKTLNEEQILGVQEYLRKKWISTADLGSPRSKIFFEGDSEDYRFSEDISLCEGENYLGLSDSGSYKREMKTSFGQDSIITSHIEVINVRKPEISQTGNELRSSVSADSYRWYLNGEVIPDSENRTLIANKDGDYSVRVTESGCHESSDNFSVILSSLDEVLSNSINIYPNPAQSSITLELPNQKLYQYEIINMLGQKMIQGQAKIRNEVDISSLKSGVYKIVLFDTSSSNNISFGSTDFALKTFIKID